ncbi:MAG: hypothetical protein J6M21_06715 [Campylobacter sp.]|nr:hypothetical protein [Campylobacter sp.]
MFDLRVFRFEPKIDILSYFKPYFYEKLDFKTLRDLLDDIKANDPYFDFSKAKFAKVNDFGVSLDENLSNLINLFGKELVISPLSERFSYKDLNFHADEFNAKFEIFKEFANSDDKAFYDSLVANFYCDKIVKFSENYLGNSSFIFAKYLCEKYPEKKSQICEIIKPQMAYFAPAKVLNLANGSEAFEYFCKELNYKKPEITPRCDLDENLSKNDFKHKFDKFSVAVYGDENLEKIAQNLGAKILNFKAKELKFNPEIYEIDKECALGILSEIIFDAYDSGADFLLVGSQKEFELFDGKNGEICNFFGRNLSGFYVLKCDEFLALAKGEKPRSLSEHKLKVTLS